MGMSYERVNHKLVAQERYLESQGWEFNEDLWRWVKAAPMVPVAVSYSPLVPLKPVKQAALGLAVIAGVSFGVWALVKYLGGR